MREESRKGHLEHVKFVHSETIASIAIGDIIPMVKIKEEENGGLGY